MKQLSVRHKDFIVVVVGVLVTYTLSVSFNLAEALSRALVKYEEVQLDEITLTLFFLAFLCIWYSNRRVKELVLETNLRKQVESHLQNSQQLYKTLFDGDLTGNCVMRINGDILMSNFAFKRICNLSSHTKNVQPLFDFDWQMFTSELSLKREINHTKLKVIQSDNSPCYVIARFIYIKSGFELQNESTLTPQIHLYLVDITEQCLAEHDLDRTLKENQYLARHAIHIQEKERKFIAQEIHDETGQYLTSIRMDALAIQKSDLNKAIEIATRIASNTGHVQKTIHALIKQLRPIALNSQGLAEAIKQLAQDWRQHNHSTYFELDLGLDDYAFSEDINIVAFRIVQESLTNISKHTNASYVRVKVGITIIESQQTLVIEVQDNGKGINFKKPNGLGLVGMRERVESLCGKFSIDSEKNIGTTIISHIPIPAVSISSPEQLFN